MRTAEASKIDCEFEKLHSISKVISMGVNV